MEISGIRSQCLLTWMPFCCLIQRGPNKVDCWVRIYNTSWLRACSLWSSLVQVGESTLKWAILPFCSDQVMRVVVSCCGDRRLWRLHILPGLPLTQPDVNMARVEIALGSCRQRWLPTPESRSDERKELVGKERGGCKQQMGACLWQTRHHLLQRKEHHNWGSLGGDRGPQHGWSTYS